MTLKTRASLPVCSQNYGYILRRLGISPYQSSVAGKPVIISKPTSIVCRIDPAISFTMIAYCYMFRRSFRNPFADPCFQLCSSSSFPDSLCSICFPDFINILTPRDNLCRKLGRMTMCQSANLGFPWSSISLTRSGKVLNIFDRRQNTLKGWPSFSFACNIRWFTFYHTTKIGPYYSDLFEKLEIAWFLVMLV